MMSQKLQSSLTGFLNLQMSPLYSNGLHSHSRSQSSGVLVGMCTVKCTEHTPIGTISCCEDFDLKYFTCNNFNVTFYSLFCAFPYITLNNDNFCDGIYNLFKINFIRRASWFAPPPHLSSTWSRVYPCWHSSVHYRTI